MFAMLRSSHPQLGYRLIALVTALVWVTAALVPASAQSPVAYPPIKLIHLYEHTCPAGVDPLAGAVSDAANACPQSISNVNFTLTSQDPSFAPQTHPTDSLGATEWHKVPSGFPYAIQQAVPPGYGNPVVRCQMGQNAQTGSNYVEITFNAPGGRLDIGAGDLSLTYFMDNSCYWFDIPAGQTGPGSEAAQQAEVAVSDGGVPANTPTPTPTPRSGQTGLGSEAAQLTEVAVSDGGVPANTPTPTPTPRSGQTGLGSEAAQLTEVAVSDGGVPANTPTTTPTPTPTPRLVIDTAPQIEVAEASADTTENTPTPTPLLSTEPGSETVPQAQSAQPNANGGDAAASPQVQAVQVGGARLDIRAWTCPFHYDAAAASVAELQAQCSSPHRDANFIINGDPASLKYTGDIGAVSYQSVPFGTVTIQLQAGASLDPVRVFCYTLPATASHGPLLASQEIGFTEEAGDTFSVSIQVHSGEAIDCIWFDGYLTEDDLGTVLLHKYVCPDGFNTSAGGLNELLSGCPTPQVAYFELKAGAGSSGNQTDASGYLGFVNSSPGMYTLRETEPLGYATARIFCRTYNADDWNHIVDPYIEQTVIAKTGFAVQIQAHFEIECAWFDIKGVNNGYLDINARSCPLAFNPTATTPYATFAQQCQIGISGATFDVSSQLSDFNVTATSTNGSALFQEPVPVGGMSIYSQPPQAYTLVNAFCGSAPFVGIGAIPTSWTMFASGSVLYDVPVGYQVVCEYFYKPLVIAQGEAASPEAVETTGDGAPDSETADASPVAVPTAGSADESGSDGQSGSSTGNGSSNPVASGTPTGSASGGSGSTTQPPADANTPATLTIAIFSCPPGYDLYAPDAEPAGDCLDRLSGIDFSLSAPGEPDLAATSDAEGRVSWTDLTAGSYLVQQASPPETQSAFIADCQSDQRPISENDPLGPFAFAGPEGQIRISLLAGEVLTCSWYTIPAVKEGTIAAQIFSCTGTSVNKAQCAPAAGPATLQFEPAPGESGAAFEVQIGGDGTGQATAAAGTYALTGLPIDACLVESDAFDDTGSLTIEENASVEVRIYTCGA